jgi:hypothetical protein
MIHLYRRLQPTRSLLVPVLLVAPKLCEGGWRFFDTHRTKLRSTRMHTPRSLVSMKRDGMQTLPLITVRPYKHTVKIIACVFLLLTFTPFGHAAETTRQSQENDIYEAVFRWQFEHNASGQQTNAKVYFLGVGEKATDPSDAFMKRFVDHKPPVRKASASHYVRGKGILDTKTGEQGLAFRALNIKWMSDDEVEIHGGYHEAEESSSGNTYTVKKESGKWKVIKDKMNWIS